MIGEKNTLAADCRDRTGVELGFDHLETVSARLNETREMIEERYGQASRQMVSEDGNPCCRPPNPPRSALAEKLQAIASQLEVIDGRLRLFAESSDL